MIGLPSLLLVLVVVTHYSYELLATMYSDQQAAAKAWFYILRGVEGCLLFAVIWTLCPRKPRAAFVGASIACAWGMLEEAQTAACRIAMPIANIASAPAFRGLCDVVTGWPIYAATMFAALVVASLAQESGDATQAK